MSDTIAELVHEAGRRLEEAGLVFAHGTTDPVAEAAFFAAETLGVAPDEIESMAGYRPTPAQRTAVLALVDERIRTRRPAAYLVGRIWMLGVPFHIDERAIVPRSFLGEILADELFETLIAEPEGVRRVLDLCTGSACLAILAAMRFPEATVDAVDLSATALEVAARNVAEHGMENRVRLMQGDLFGPVGDNRYDLIIANPPYVDAEGMADLPPECRHEPALAFDGGADGLDLVRPMLRQARAHLSDNGGLLCEIGRCGPALEAAFPQTPFLWLDTEDSSGEVFWLDAAALR